MNEIIKAIPELFFGREPINIPPRLDITDVVFKKTARQFEQAFIEEQDMSRNKSPQTANNARNQQNQVGVIHQSIQHKTIFDPVLLSTIVG